MSIESVLERIEMASRGIVVILYVIDSQYNEGIGELGTIMMSIRIVI